MSNVLLIASSPRGEGSHSTSVARALADRLVAATGADLTVRDLAAEPIAHLGGDAFAGFTAADRDGLTAAQRAEAEASDDLVAELFAADTIVIASPMINFSLPTQLKAWFDRILKAGATFRYTQSGAEGLVKGKKAYLVLARGGIYSEGPLKAVDHQEPYLRTLLGFIGITDVETVRIEGVAYGPDHARKAVDAALERVAALAPGEQRAA